jgi:anti-anti-sigma regulatory factor
MSFTETIAVGRTFTGPGEPPVDPTRNSSLPGPATWLRVVRRDAGRRRRRRRPRSSQYRWTQPEASLVTAAVALATMLFLAPLLGLLPYATLAAVVIVYSIVLIQPAEFFAIRKVRTMEFRWAVAAALGVLIFGTLDGIVVAIVLSLIGLSSQTAHPRLSIIGRKRCADVLRPLSPEHPDDETFEGLLILRPEGRLFFVNAQYVGEQIQALVDQYKPRVVALDMSRVIDIEYSALSALMEGEKRATAAGTVVWLAALNPGVLDVVRSSGLAERLGRDRLLFNARAVIERYQAMQGAGPSGAGTVGAPLMATNASAAQTRCTAHAGGWRCKTRSTEGDNHGKEERSQKANRTRASRRRSVQGKSNGKNKVATLMPPPSTAKAELSGKEYAREMRKLHVELVKLQEWVKPRAEGLHRVRGPRRRRQGRHDQGDHRTREPARVSRRRPARADRAREVPDVRAALPAASAGGGEVVISTAAGTTARVSSVYWGSARRRKHASSCRWCRRSKRSWSIPGSSCSSTGSRLARTSRRAG